jgi:hypothetical protein
VFAELAGKVRPSDVFVFFVAGHVKTGYYFLPQDFRYEGEGGATADHARVLGLRTSRLGANLSLCMIERTLQPTSSEPAPLLLFFRILRTLCHRDTVRGVGEVLLHV